MAGNTSPLSLDKTGTEVTGSDKSAVHVVIPEGVTRICSEAFVGCTSLTTLEIPNSVTSIGAFAFHNCIYEA